MQIVVRFQRLAVDKTSLRKTQISQLLGSSEPPPQKNRKLPIPQCEQHRVINRSTSMLYMPGAPAFHVTILNDWGHAPPAPSRDEDRAGGEIEMERERERENERAGGREGKRAKRLPVVAGLQL